MAMEKGFKSKLTGYSANLQLQLAVDVEGNPQ
jgi:hypothetical protein